MPVITALTTEVGFRVGPVLLEVLAKHYLERNSKDGSSNDDPKLRKSDILYDEAFSIVKAFLNAASCHTVEDLQAFSNTATPSPPWVHVVRETVPMASCDLAASYLIKALGGEDVCRKVVGGVRWWQVRGIKGVDAQWIAAKKDWKEAKRRHKQRGTGDTWASGTKAPSDDGEEGVYEKDMDAMRCILYLHGGGYYFGSVDQERYSIQRLARKINGRVFAINYRLSPQYPFPCAIQDALASYLFLIQPPPGSLHQPVDPAHIVVTGDSAGGGLSLALLQVIRDSGLPAPAGGLLISPWCDLTHSFPSIHLNTATDVIPDAGLSFHRPSTLWPPPPPEVSDRVHASIRHRIRQLFKVDDAHTGPTDTIAPNQHVTSPISQLPETPGLPVDVGSTTAVPPIDSTQGENSERVQIVTASESLLVDNQIQLYTRNSLLVHPLVSPALSYLGDLPPLFFIASDREVLRDEIIYTAHRAANPSMFPLKQASRDLYPALNAFKEMKPTSVHLQVYDDTAHVLPILFAFTTPAKFCFRAMATFCKLVTEIPLGPKRSPTGDSADPTNGNSKEVPSPPNSPPPSEHLSTTLRVTRRMSSVLSAASFEQGSSGRPSTLRRALSARISLSRTTMVVKNRSMSDTFQVQEVESPGAFNSADSLHLHVPPRSRVESAASSRLAHEPTTQSSQDVAGPRFSFSKPSSPALSLSERMAGEASVYSSIKNVRHWETGMIRERVSTEGVIRPLEAEPQLEAMQMPEHLIGRISELALRRYLDTQNVYSKKFAHTYKMIDKRRRRNLERAKRDTIKRMGKIKKSMNDRERREGSQRSSSEQLGGTEGGAGAGGGALGCAAVQEGDMDVKAYLLSSPGWNGAWALDEDENPPPSSIVARRDTDEARQLAEVADHALLGGEHAFSGNNLWSVIVDFFTVKPEKQKAPPAPPKEKAEAPALLSVKAGLRHQLSKRFSTMDKRPSGSAS